MTYNPMDNPEKEKNVLHRNEFGEPVAWSHPIGNPYVSPEKMVKFMDKMIELAEDEEIIKEFKEIQKDYQKKVDDSL